jgi:hypothetical protein
VGTVLKPILITLRKGIFLFLIPFLPVRNKGKFSDTTMAKISALYRNFWGIYIYASECTYFLLFFSRIDENKLKQASQENSNS